jgi:hypothetical protein
MPESISGHMNYIISHLSKSPVLSTYHGPYERCALKCTSGFGTERNVFYLNGMPPW